MLKQVPTIKTTPQTDELISALCKAWFSLWNEIPKKESIGVIYSQWALETGMGAHCYNWNLGNVKAVDNKDQIIEYCALNGVWEIINGKKVFLSPDNPGSWFRSFPNLEEGCKFHLNLIKNGRFASSWSAVESGNPGAFAHLLKLKGYYTAPEQDYVKLINYYFNKYMKDLSYDKVILDINSQKSEDPIKIDPVSNDFQPEVSEDNDEPKNIELSPWQKFKKSIFSIWGK